MGILSTQRSSNYRVHDFTYNPTCAVPRTYNYAPTSEFLFEIDEPWYRINAAGLLTKNGTFIASAKPEQLDYFLPTISLLDQEEACLLYAWLREIPPTLSTSYAIAWYTSTYIMLTDNDDRNFCIRCNTHTRWNPTLLAHCYALKNALCSKDKNCVWIADVRFAHQIVVNSIRR